MTVHLMVGGNFVCEECGDVKHVSDLVVADDNGERVLCSSCYVSEIETLKALSREAAELHKTFPTLEFSHAG